MDEQKRKQLESEIAGWKELAKAIESKPLESLIGNLEFQIKRADTGDERLRQAMAREAKLKDDAAKVPALEKQIAEMAEHPDVKAARLRKLSAEINRMQAEAAKLKPEEKKPE